MYRILCFRFQVNGLQHHDYVGIQTAIHDCVIKKEGIFMTIDVCALIFIRSSSHRSHRNRQSQAWEAEAWEAEAEAMVPGENGI